VHVLGHQYAPLVVQPQGTAFERLVMKGAKRKTVVGAVGTAGGMPLDVGRFETQPGIAKLAVVAANGAAKTIYPRISAPTTRSS
jgi:hypothetical protein